MVAVFTTVVDDPDLHPIPGVKVSIKTDDGLLATLFDPANFAIEIDNPVLSDAYGVVTFAAVDDVYFGEYRFAGVLRRVDSILVGLPPAFVGPSGPANATYLTLAALKASSTTNGTALLTAAGNQGYFTWTLGNYTGLADDVNIVKADSTALSGGAWVRQKADSISLIQSGSNTVTTDLATTVKALAAVPAQFTSVSNTLVQSVTLGVPTVLPGAVTNTATALVGTSGNFALTGIAGKTALTATAAMQCVIDVRNGSEVSYSPFSISGIDINGASLATIAGIGVRYRRNYTLANMLISNVPVGISLKDANSGLFMSIRTSAVQVGLDSVGSNHHTTYIGCAFSSASNVAIRLADGGTALDGNRSHTFVGCNAQNNARCIEVGYKTQLDWIGGYLGEADSGYTIDNKGGIVNVVGGDIYFDYVAGNYLVHPVGSGTAAQGGVTRFRGSRLNAQGVSGSSKLVYLAPGEVDLTKNGKVTFEDIDLYCPPAGGALFNGDSIGCLGPTRGLVKRNGRSWSQFAFTGSAPTNFTVSTSGNAQTITNTATSPPAGIGFSCPLNNTDFRTDGPMFVIICYQSSKGVVVRTDTAPGAGGGTVLGSTVATGALSATGWKTFVSFEATPSALSSGVMTIYINGDAVAGDYVSLLRAGLADADFVNSGGKAGVLSNLFYP